MDPSSLNVKQSLGLPSASRPCARTWWTMASILKPSSRYLTSESLLSVFSTCTLLRPPVWHALREPHAHLSILLFIALFALETWVPAS